MSVHSFRVLPQLERHNDLRQVLPKQGNDRHTWGFRPNWDLNSLEPDPHDIPIWEPCHEGLESNQHLKETYALRAFAGRGNISRALLLAVSPPLTRPLTRPFTRSSRYCIQCTLILLLQPHIDATR